MADQPATQLWVQYQSGGAIVHVRQAPAEPAAPPSGDALVRVGVASVAAGILLGVFGATVMGPVLAIGGFCAVLIGRRQNQQRKALPPAREGDDRAATSPAVRSERGRRVLLNLEQAGPTTFEALLARLHWTEPALLETLVQLKNEGRIDEDLDLDSGQWIYRPMGRQGSSAGSLTLEERQSRMQLEKE